MPNQVTMWSVPCGLIVLVVAVLSNIPSCIAPSEGAGSMQSRLEALLATHEGCATRELAIGATEALEEKTRDVLEYDAVIHREYTAPHGTFTLYVGYWRAGRRSPVHIASHTPDRCWTLAGMKCDAQQSHYVVSGADVRMGGGHWRQFRTPSGDVLETVFWHIVGGRIFDDSIMLTKNNEWVRLKAVIRDGLFQGDEQYFIRLVSHQSLSRFNADSCFNDVLKAIVSIYDRKV